MGDANGVHRWRLARRPRTQTRGGLNMVRDIGSMNMFVLIGYLSTHGSVGKS